MLEQLRGVLRAPRMVAADVVTRAAWTAATVSRMVNLITLAPDIVAAILDKILPLDLTLYLVRS